MVTADRAARGREAFDRHAWTEAYDGLADADSESPLGALDLERLATAAYLSGHDRQSTDAWARAHRAWLEGGEPERSVLCAFWLGLGLILRGDMAEGGGWMARARRLVAERELDCVGAGYLLVPAALMDLFQGAHDAAREKCAEAGAFAQRFDDADLRVLSLLGRGQALCRAGRIDEGAESFDEAMVSVTGGEVSPVVAGIVYCAVIDECQQAFDVARARAWTAALGRWCDAQPGLVAYRGQCLVHRSQVLQLHGAWQDAMADALGAELRLSEPPHPAVGMAHYQLGELQRLRGELDQAEASYVRAQQSGRPPQPGLALVWLARGDADAAAAAIDAAVAGGGDAISHAQLLPAFVEIMLSVGRVEDARHQANELAAIAGTSSSSFLAAAALQAEGAVLLAEGDPREALARLRRAGELWRELETPYEAAQAQVLVATGCRAIGDDETAQLECESARRTFAQLGALGALAQLDQAFGPAPASGGGPGVSPRELQVLRRVAQGMTNQQIAADLFISIKTVERHLSNLFAKLDVPNRAAATAIAYDTGLLE